MFRFIYPSDWNRNQLNQIELHAGSSFRHISVATKFFELEKRNNSIEIKDARSIQFLVCEFGGASVFDSNLFFLNAFLTSYV